VSMLNGATLRLNRLLKKPSTGGPSFETLALLAPQDEAFQCFTSP
jgi:hypothetical protein